MSEEIKPCPFCGSEDVEVFSNYGRYFVTCCDCGSEGPNKEGKEEAIKGWNQRPYDFDMPAIVKKVQWLEKENEKLRMALIDYADPNNWSIDEIVAIDLGLDFSDREKIIFLYQGNGYDLAKSILKELESCKQPE